MVSSLAKNEFNVVVEEQVLPLIQTLLVDHPALPPPSFKILTFVIFLSY
jgi:hypothetical protein